MKTKTTKREIIYALKVRMNSAMIEKSHLNDALLNADINEIEYRNEINSIFEDLKHYVEML